MDKLLYGMITIAAILGISAFFKKSDSVYNNDELQQNPMRGKKVRFIENESDVVNGDGVKGHLEVIDNTNYSMSLYEGVVKRGIDIILSLGGLILLSPVFIVLSLWIIIDDPGPIFFVQKRIGLDKQYFKLHKFRSMKMNTPHDKPTHMLENPEQYITKAGRFIREHSLDELPQIWDILVGNMSVVGPRPALWNQDLLVAERDKWGANDIKPGLTGWAQINGRDELEIAVKAKLDGEYAVELSRGGWNALWMDIRCFLKTIKVFAGDSSVVEGGPPKRDVF